MGQTDPQWFVNMESVALAQGWSADDFLKLVRTGSDRFPTYLPIYQSGMTYFAPRWYGDNARMDAFARMAAERTAATVKSLATGRRPIPVSPLYRMPAGLPVCGW